MRKIALVAIALAPIGVAAFLWSRAVWTQAEDGAAGAEVVGVVRRDVGSVVKATGIIEPRVGAEVGVGSRISGVVKRHYVRIGDRVAKGQLLAELDDRDLIARRDEAAAAVQQADVNLSYARTDLQRTRANKRRITPLLRYRSSMWATLQLVTFQQQSRNVCP